MLHDLPSDPLAAWFYKNDEGSSEIGMSDPNQTSSNAGEVLPAVPSWSACARLDHLLMPTWPLCSITRNAAFYAVAICRHTNHTKHDIRQSRYTQELQNLCNDRSTVMSFTGLMLCMNGLWV